MQLERERLWLAVVQQGSYEADVALVSAPLCIDLAVDVDEIYVQGWSRVLAEALVAQDGSPGGRIKAICCGATSTAVLTSRGEVWTFGWGDRGQLGQGSCLNSPAMRRIARFQFVGSTVHRPMLSQVFIRKVAAGDEHTILLSEKGEVFAFGSNSWGQLGLASHATSTSSRNFSTLPRLVQLNRSTVDVACGSCHTAALLDGGVILTWGSWDLVRPEPDDLWMPRRVQNCPHVSRSIACGRHYTLVHAHDGHIWAWGSNQLGQLGLGEQVAASRKPARVCVPLSALARGHQAAGDTLPGPDVSNTSGAGRTVGQVPGKGGANFAAMGLPPGQRVALGPPGAACGAGKVVRRVSDGCYLVQLDEEGSTTPVRMARRDVDPLQFLRAKLVAAGAAHCVAVTTSGAVLAWGHNRNGQVGTSISRSVVHFPTRVEGLPDPATDPVCTVAAGLRHSVAGTSSCRLFSWGLVGPFRFVNPAALSDSLEAYGRSREPSILHESLARFPGVMASPSPVEAVGWAQGAMGRPESVQVACSFSRSMSVTLLASEFAGPLGPLPSATVARRAPCNPGEPPLPPAPPVLRSRELS